MKIISTSRIAALLAVMVLSAAMVLSASFAAFASQSSKDTPSIKVEGPDEDIPQKIVTSASNYLDISSDDDLDKAPTVLDAAKAAETEKESESGADSDSDSGMLVDMTEDEIYMFAAEVYCEAGDESYESQVGVAQVIINRIRSPKYPNTLEDVLYQSGQFPPATDGFMDRVMASGEGNACRKAVMDALHGADVVGDYLYFNMTSGVDFSTVTSSMTIDGTTFYSINE